MVTWLIILSIYGVMLTAALVGMSLRQQGMDADLQQLKIWKDQQQRLQQMGKMGVSNTP